MSDLTAAQSAFVKDLEQKINQQLRAKLDGEFSFINYAPGFFYFLQGDANNYYNPNALQDIDAVVRPTSDGLLTLDTSSAFSTLYMQILKTATYQLSTADTRSLNSALQAAQAQQSSVISIFEANYGAITDEMISTSGCLPASKVGFIMKFVQTEFEGDIKKCPFNDLRVAWQRWAALAAPAVAISQAQTDALGRLQSAIDNTQKPSAASAGLQVAKDRWEVGYVNLPSTGDVVSSLSDANQKNAVSIDCSFYSFASDSASFDVDAQTGFTIPLDFLSVKVGANVNYSLREFSSATKNIKMSLTWPCITVLGGSPMPLSKDEVQGWYDEAIVTELVENTGKDVTGYVLASGEFGPDKTFGPGKPFSRARTFVLSQQPTIKMSFQATTVSEVSKFFHEDASVSLKLFGFLPLGSASESYTVSSVREDASSTGVEVVLTAPAISGNTPDFQWTCYVLGGVVAYPPLVNAAARRLAATARRAAAHVEVGNKFSVSLHLDSPKRNLGLLEVTAWADDWMESLGATGCDVDGPLPGPSARVILDCPASVTLARVQQVIMAWNRHHVGVHTSVS